jgi:hypothetical protein
MRRDYDKIRNMLNRAGIPFRVEEDHHRETAAHSGLREEPRVVAIEVERGYVGFFTRFEFHPDTGDLVDIGAWE